MYTLPNYARTAQGKRKSLNRLTLFGVCSTEYTLKTHFGKFIILRFNKNAYYEFGFLIEIMYVP